ncbi:NAD-P-binding protein [Fomitopsis serialis]|uniref:NAD-P-binding protein n=1 Tax=Fomitopsis serialis TaxID=139415 RepID=UPI0020073799|nr:NAD-P-binding protein [Neoantrodia serialis]KAH9915673.1 NAD-P-binding protein [Neoantrodia serialis]
MSNPFNITDNLHHDVYSAIDPRGVLKDSCQGKSVLVTGAGRGIGKAIAVAFALAGASNIVLTARSQSELESARDDILSAPQLSAPPKVLVQVTDVTSEDSVKALFDVLAREGVHIDVLVNNAGYLEKTVPVHAADPSEWWKTWEVNIKGTFLPTHYLLKSVFTTNTTAPTPITIICTSSVGGLRTRPGFSGYQTTKTAINRFAEFLHAEYGEKGVRAFAYHPGGVLTKLAEYGMPPETHNTLLIDKPELAGGFCVFLTAPGKYVDTDVFRGKYISCSWDVEDMVREGREAAGTEGEDRWLTMKLVL